MSSTHCTLRYEKATPAQGYPDALELLHARGIPLGSEMVEGAYSHLREAGCKGYYGGKVFGYLLDFNLALLSSLEGAIDNEADCAHYCATSQLMHPTRLRCPNAF